MKHQNNGKCPKCQEIFDRYPGFYQPLRDWFEKLQVEHPEAHISCAGRGEIEQEDAFILGRTRARFGQSAHNYNCAIDIFVMQKGLNIYDRDWFNSVIAPRITAELEWYGAPRAKFFELPHVQLRGWKKLKDEGVVHIVEDYDDVA